MVIKMCHICALIVPLIENVSFLRANSGKCVIFAQTTNYYTSMCRQKRTRNREDPKIGAHLKQNERY